MVACDEHKKRGKGSCSECGGCKCCPPPAGCSGVDHIQVGLGKGGGKRRRTRKEEAAQEGGMQQQKTRRSSRNSDVRGRHRKSMAEPESPDRPPPAAMQQPPPAARRTATASSAARSVAEAIISEMGKAAANGDAARSLESIVADAIEPHDLFTFFLDGCDLAELIDEVASRAPQDDGETETASDIWSEVSAMKRTLPLFQKEVVDYASHHVRDLLITLNGMTTASRSSERQLPAPAVAAIGNARAFHLSQMIRHY